MPAPVKGLEKLVKSIRGTSDEGIYSVSFEVHPDGNVHDFKMELKQSYGFPREADGTLWSDPNAFNSSAAFMEHGVPDTLHIHSMNKVFYRHPEIRAISYATDSQGNQKAYLFGLPIWVDDRYPQFSTLSEIVEHSVKMCHIHNNDE